jgi:hypothetical protein
MSQTGWHGRLRSVSIAIVKCVALAIRYIIGIIRTEDKELCGRHVVLHLAKQNLSKRA